MAGYVVTTEELDALAKQIIEIDGQTQATLRQVRNTAETVRSSWDGQAATAFTNMMVRFDDDTKKVQEALRSIAEQISESAKTYAAEEEAQTSTVTEITGRLG